MNFTPDLWYNEAMNDSARKAYEKTVPTTEISVNGIYTVHYFKYGQQFAFEGERHDFWELVYIDAGQVDIASDEHELTLVQGEAYFHKPNEYHSIRANGRFANSVIVSFDCGNAAMKVFENLRITLDLEERSLLAAIVKEASACFSDALNDVELTKMTALPSMPFGGEQLIKLYIEQLLILLYRRVKAQKSADLKMQKSANDITERIKTLLSESLYGNITLAELSSELFFSKTYLKAVFKRSTGQTIMQYYTKMKLDEAKKLISENKYTFTDIAYKLGYSSLHYFSRLFKKYVSMSPTEYASSIKVEHIL